MEERGRKTLTAVFSIRFAIWLPMLALAVFPARGDHPASGVRIFNGTDLSGWIAPLGNEQRAWYRAQDGVLHLQSDPEKKGSVLCTAKSYRDFYFHCEFRFGQGTVDSGIFIRNKDQIQIGVSGSLKRDMTGSPYIPGKGYPVEAKGVEGLLKSSEWNDLRIEAVGANYKVWLNGVAVLDYHSETAVAEGPIGIQLHSEREMSMSYRNITLREY